MKMIHSLYSYIGCYGPVLHKKLWVLLLFYLSDVLQTIIVYMSTSQH